MLEPDAIEVKDSEGYSWVKTKRGWSLKNHDQICYQDLPWKKVEAEYGPMFIRG